MLSTFPQTTECSNVVIKDAQLCVAIWGRPTPRQLFSTLTEPPTSANFEVDQPVRCCFIAFYCWYVTLRCDLDLWLRTLISAVTRSNFVPNLRKIEQFAAELRKFQYLTLRPWTFVTYCAMLWNNFHTQFQLRRLIRAWHVTIFVLMYADTLWHWSLTIWPWTFAIDRMSHDQTVPKMSEIEQSAAELLTI